MTLQSSVKIDDFASSGLPKAATFHYRRGFSAAVILTAAGGTADDVVYTPLPLYHSSAGMLGLLGTLSLGEMIF